MDYATHTPGPWFPVQIEGTPSTGETVAFVQGPRRIVRDKSFGYSPEDARLIAAAPDLLAALKDAATRLRGAGMLSGNDEVLRAIAKAQPLTPDTQP